jgi:excisionase family DNA binding protein
VSEYRDQLLTAKETAEVLSVSLARLYELARVGTVPVVRVGRQVRFSREALSSWITSGGKPLPDTATPARQTARAGSKRALQPSEREQGDRTLVAGQ